eukprot:3888559-Karenia_brevis.AAC.1
MNALGRGTCRVCKFIRPMRSRQCPRCGLSVLARAVCAGDAICPAETRHVHFSEDSSAEASQAQDAA